MFRAGPIAVWVVSAHTQNRNSLARWINNLFPVSSKKYTVMYSQAVKLVAKYGEDWMTNVVFRRAVLKMTQKHENLASAHAHKVLPISVTNRITSATRVSNLGKIGEKLCPLALMKEKILLHWKLVAMHCALHECILALNGTHCAPFIWSLCCKFGEDWSKIESMTDYRLQWFRCDHSVTDILACVGLCVCVRTYAWMDGHELIL